MLIPKRNYSRKNKVIPGKTTRWYSGRQTNDPHASSQFSAWGEGDKEEKETNMTTDLDASALKRGSPLFWCTLLVPIGIIAIGINFILNPVGASTAYGIPIHDPTAFPFMWIKGIRDIFSGIVILPFLWRGDRRTTATLFAIAILIPISDGLVILAHRGFAAPIYTHWGTALYMTIVAAFLLGKRNPRRSPIVAG
jgi:hypothetical protein